MGTMSVRSVLFSLMLILVILIVPAVSEGGFIEEPSKVEIEVFAKPNAQFLETEISGSVRNNGLLAADLSISSASFPFEMELLDVVGRDVLAKFRRPEPTHRTRKNPLQVVHLAPGEKKTFTITLAAYLESRGFPRAIEKVTKVRLIVAASMTGGSGSSPFSVLRSNTVDIETH
jgi:hypothetical protein